MPSGFQHLRWIFWDEYFWDSNISIRVPWKTLVATQLFECALANFRDVSGFDLNQSYSTQGGWNHCVTSCRFGNGLGSLQQSLWSGCCISILALPIDSKLGSTYFNYQGNQACGVPSTVGNTRYVNNQHIGRCLACGSVWFRNDQQKKDVINNAIRGFATMYLLMIQHDTTVILVIIESQSTVL